VAGCYVSESGSLRHFSVSDATAYLCNVTCVDIHMDRVPNTMEEHCENRIYTGINGIWGKNQFSRRSSVATIQDDDAFAESLGPCIGE